MTPKVKGKGTETGEPTSPKSIVPETDTREWELRVRRDALMHASRDSSHGRRAGLPSAR